MYNRLVLLCLLLTVAGCSSSTKDSSATRTIPESHSSETNASKVASSNNRSEVREAEIAAEPTVRTAPLESSQPKTVSEPRELSLEEILKSPDEGLTVEQRSVKEMAQDIFKPITESSASGYGSLKEVQKRAQGIMKFGQYKVTFNQEAETRLRASMNEVKKAENSTTLYLDAITRAWKSPNAKNPYPARKLLISTYEKLLDEGVVFSPETRRTLGEMARSEGPKVPVFFVPLESNRPVNRFFFCEGQIAKLSSSIHPRRVYDGEAWQSRRALGGCDR